MPDITKCEGYDCPLKEQCYRFVSKDSDWQSYFVEDPRRDPINHPKMCDYFWQEGKIDEAPKSSK